MLPDFHNQCYQKFKQVLLHLQGIEASVPLDAARLRQNFSEAQQFFQQQILSLDAADLEPADAARVLSYQTEISKQLRLVEMCVVFLQAARQPTTVMSRQQELSRRIQTLTRYCDALLQLN